VNVISKFNTINKCLSNIPSALAGLALGIASLGLCWENRSELNGSGQMFAAIVASCILLPLLFKFIFNPAILKQDLADHVGGGVAPTLAMAMMVVANNIAIYSLQLGKIISLLAIIIHLCFLVIFIFYRSKNFRFEHILPSWFIPPIGLVIALIMYPGGISHPLANLILKFGLICYALLLPVVLYRLLFGEKLCDHEKPILVILATPASLLLAGYFEITEQPSYLMIAILVPLAVTMTLFAYFSFSKLLRLPFTPAYSAFTFPLVVGATALFKTSQFLLKEGNMQLSSIVEQLAYLELLIATAMVIYVSLRYMRYFLTAPKVFTQ
jgi:exfoliative toxin A/B